MHPKVGDAKGPDDPWPQVDRVVAFFEQAMEVNVLLGLTPGDRLSRREVHERYGGPRQGGISPSLKASVVMFFADPITGHKHGYYDGLDDDGLFHYVGEGQRGDQQIIRGNKAIARHGEDGRSLEGFLVTSGTVTYLGPFALVDTYRRDAHETGSLDILRQVIVFRLRPLGQLPSVDIPHVPVTPPSEVIVEQVPVEEQHSERAFVAPNRESYELERSEARLVSLYREYLASHGHQVQRLRILPPGEGAPLYCDLWDETTAELVEAKGRVTRDQIRQGVGQLLDYGRFVEARTRTILLPSAPRRDLVSYVKSVGIDIVYPVSTSWIRTSGDTGGKLER